MAPWMVITGLIVVGFVVLLIAPTIHRRINTNSRETAEANRIARAHELQSSADGTSQSFSDAASAVRMRDRLLLRGVRSEVVTDDDGKTILIYRRSDTETVRAVQTELGLD